MSEGNNLRKIEEFCKLRRSPAQSHWRTQAELCRRAASAGNAPLARLKDYVRIQAVSWVYHYIKSRFGSRHSFQGYQGTETGIYNITPEVAKKAVTEGEDEVRISLAGDWGTGTDEAQKIGCLMGSFKPHVTIHLGDVYYVGTKEEIRENFFTAVQWPRGSVGSFALNGNHEMYAKGNAYFKFLLPELGIVDPATCQLQGQNASFFCLETDHWRLIGLDTGYNSVGTPILEKVPFVKRFFNPECALPKRLLKWLDEQVRPSEDKRGIILLSHHQYYSAFENGYEKAAKQLRKSINRPVLWFWGHEHRMAVYGKSGEEGGIEAYGRCIGHGGMPVEEYTKKPGEKEQAKYKLVGYDNRYKRTAGKTQVGYNGYANLTFRGPYICIEYRDIDNNTVLLEEWKVDIGTGALQSVCFDNRLLHLPPGAEEIVRTLCEANGAKEGTTQGAE